MKQALIFCLLILLFSPSFSQNFDSTLAKYTGAYVPERIHIHFDKTSYSAGDTIWYKAYIMEGISPTENSKSVYIDWTDQNGKLVSRSMSPVVAGVTYGQLPIPLEYKSDFIHAKAYTRWMLNFDSAFLFNKDIRVFSKNKISPKSVKTVNSLNLFPESGNLVEGLFSKVAFKATDQFGRPIHVKGNIVIDGHADEKIYEMHDGMGFFFIRPDVGKEYAVLWTDSTGTDHVTPFPQILNKGVILQVADAQKNKSFMVHSNDPLINIVHIIGTMYQQPVFNISKTLEKGVSQGLIPVQSLPSGILTITVLDQNYHPLAERITFIDNREYKFKTGLNVAHWGLNQRAKNEIEIEIPDSIFANLSVSITDNSIDFDSTHSIISDLLLSSELKGKIFNPVFYFSNDPDSTRGLLDLVMLTNGWRKISWKDLSRGELPEIKFPADTSYQTVSGKIYGATSSQLRSAGDIVLIINQKDHSEFMTASVNDEGNFKLNNYMLFDTATVYYQPPKGKHMSNVSVQFMEDKLPARSLSPAGTDFFTWNPDTSGLKRHLQLSSALQEALAYYGGKVLEAVTIKARTKSTEELLDEKYTSGMFSGGNSRGFDLRDDPAASASQNIFQYLQGRIAGVTIGMGNPPSISWRNGTPALFLNEMPVEAEMLSTIPVSDIAYVKVLNPPFMGAIGGGGNGAIAIYTRKGGDVESTPGKGLSKNTLTGYSVIREFYSPDYDRINPDQRDLRTTLYWNPEIILNPNHRKTTLKFFNNDFTHAFRVVIEGITPDGRMTRLVKVME